MSDKELLVLAAKAAKILPSDFGGEHDLEEWWNPLTDDGDALRLAVKLNINVYVREAYPYSEKEDGYPIELGCLISEKEEPDPYAATRRAIVRAAAEIGKTK